MNSRIIDPDYTHWEETKIWDKVIAQSMEIMYQTAAANDGIIVIDLDEEESDDDNYMIKIAKLCNTVQTFPILLNTSFFRARRIAKKNPTFKIKKLYKKKFYIPISANSIKDYLKVYMPEIYSDDIFEKIYTEYWDEVLNAIEVEQIEEEGRIED